MKQGTSAYPNDEWVIFMKLAMGEITRENAPELKRPKLNDPYHPETTAEAECQLPKSFALVGNYPNPFNPETAIRYALPQQSHVLIEIYNVLGQKVATLVDENLPAGYHTARWDGKDAAGKKAPAGIYLCRMQTGDFVKTQKMTLLP